MGIIAGEKTLFFGRERLAKFTIQGQLDYRGLKNILGPNYIPFILSGNPGAWINIQSEWIIKNLSAVPWPTLSQSLDPVILTAVQA